ncbi:DNA polymerase [Paenibacillus brasilensis]|uniref:DNA polymerase n=1 Tax=Paenibacillus brasilensis TaxID=128574 RepID=A0ABU0KSD4_9BACL|nr:DNA polymerase [Paenibacillus brasilensis]
MRTIQAADRVIWGEGNPKAPLMMILDNPGAREDREGNSFLCGTRETLQFGMREAGIDVNDVYVTYLLKCRPMRVYNKPEARAACLPHLQQQLFQKQPLVLFGFGNVVAEAIFTDKESASVKELRGSWYELQGTPISFTYHPLAVRRRPNLLRFFVEDLKALKEKWKEIQLGRI